MQNLIKQIVDMDREAQKITDSAQQKKSNTEKEVSEKKEQLRNDYLEKAKKQIALIEPKERAAAESALKKKLQKNAEFSKHLDELYREKDEQWVSEIVERVLGG